MSTKTKKETHVVKFVKDKETPGTIVFKEVPPTGKPPVIRSLYIQRWAAEGAQAVTVTVDIERAAA